jgi:hypothetical protein
VKRKPKIITVRGVAYELRVSERNRVRRRYEVFLHSQTRVGIVDGMLLDWRIASPSWARHQIFFTLRGAVRALVDLERVEEI